jgi:MFS family permease
VVSNTEHVPQRTSRRDVFRVASIATAAASIEWYDFFIYGTASALVFPALFFPEQTAVTGLLLSFATFGIGFVARPLGGIAFGHYGDVKGRKSALTAALLLMGIASTLIGLMPTYSTIGVAAPIGLVCLRFLQGIAVGGQQGGVVLLAVEAAPARQRGLFGSFASVGAPGGILLANLAFLTVTATTSEDALATWGWRIPFLLRSGSDRPCALHPLQTGGHALVPSAAGSAASDDNRTNGAGALAPSGGRPPIPA